MEKESDIGQEAEEYLKEHTIPLAGSVYEPKDYNKDVTPTGKIEDREGQIYVGGWRANWDKEAGTFYYAKPGSLDKPEVFKRLIEADRMHRIYGVGFGEEGPSVPKEK